MLKTAILVSAMGAGLMVATVASAADAALGQKTFETTCVACHGAKGVSVVPIYPNLAGQKEQYLVEQLKAFSRWNPREPDHATHGGRFV